MCLSFHLFLFHFYNHPSSSGNAETSPWSLLLNFDDDKSYIIIRFFAVNPLRSFIIQILNNIPTQSPLALRGEQILVLKDYFFSSTRITSSGSSPTFCGRCFPAGVQIAWPFTEVVSNTFPSGKVKFTWLSVIKTATASG